MAAISVDGQIFFHYDNTALKREEDDLKDAIIFYYPQSCDLDSQCALCGQLMGMVNLLTSLLGAPPTVFSLTYNKLVAKHLGKYSLVLGGSLECPDEVLQRQLDTLYSVFTFYHRSLDHLWQTCLVNNDTHVSTNPLAAFEKYNTENDDKCGGIREQFIETIQEIWNTYLPFVRCYDQNLAACFQSLPTTLLTQNGSQEVILKASNLLQHCQRNFKVLGGTVFYKQSVLFTQLPLELTFRLLVIRPEFEESPWERIVLAEDQPKDMSLIKVYIPEEELPKLCTDNLFLPANYCDNLEENSPVKFAADRVSEFSQEEFKEQNENGTEDQDKFDAERETGKYLSVGRSCNRADSVRSSSSSSASENLEKTADGTKIMTSSQKSNYDELSPSKENTQYKLTNLLNDDYIAISDMFSREGTSSHRKPEHIKVETDIVKENVDENKDNQSYSSSSSSTKEANSQETSKGKRKGLRASSIKDLMHNVMEKAARGTISGKSAQSSYAQQTINESRMFLRMPSVEVAQEASDVFLVSGEMSGEISREICKEISREKECDKFVLQQDVNAASHEGQHVGKYEVLKDTTFPEISISEDVAASINLAFNVTKTPIETIQSLGKEERSKLHKESTGNTEENINETHVIDGRVVKGNELKESHSEHAMPSLVHLHLGDSDVEDNISVSSFKVQLHDKQDMLSADWEKVDSSSNYSESQGTCSVRESPEGFDEYPNKDGDIRFNEVTGYKDGDNRFNEVTGERDGDNHSNEVTDVSPAGFDENPTKDGKDIANTVTPKSATDMATSCHNKDVNSSPNNANEGCLKEPIDTSRLDNENPGTMTDRNIPIKSCPNVTQHNVNLQTTNSNSNIPETIDSTTMNVSTKDSSIYPTVNISNCRDRLLISPQDGVVNNEESTSGHMFESSAPSINEGKKTERAVETSQVDTEPARMREVTLYVQSSGDVRVMLLMAKECPAATITTMWRTVLTSLADLEASVQQKIDVTQQNSPDPHGYRFLHFDSSDKSLTGHVSASSRGLIPISCDENQFCHTAVSLHAEFAEHPGLRDVILRNHNSVVFGHKMASQETYFQRAVEQQMSSAPSEKDAILLVEKKAREKLLQNHNIFVL